MRFTRRTVLGASALSVVALAGCSQAGSGSGSGGSDGGGGTAVASDENDINAKKRGDLGEGGVLRLTNNAFPANWNPWHVDGNEANTKEILETLLPSLTKSDAKAAVSADPTYAKRLELVSEDPQVIEIELAEGLKWSDGTAIDYKSIANAFNTLNGSNEAYELASSEGYDKVEKVEPGDNDLTAKITFKEKYADWIGLATVMPDALAASPEAFNTSWVDGPKVTAGPFKIGKIDAANKTVLVEPDENWWGDKPFLKQVLWTTIEDPSAAATSYQNGQLDAINTTVAATYTVLQALVGKGSELRRSAGPNWTHLTLNGGEGRVLNDVNVRKALFQGINRKDTFESVTSALPYPKDTEQLNNHILVTNQEGYKDNAGDLGKFDVDAAKKHLEAAGYTIENNQATKDGKQLEITYVYNDGSKTNEAVVPVVQENLEAIGVKLNVQKVPPTDLFAKYISAGEYDITLFGWNGTPYLSGSDNVWKEKGGSNFAQIGSADLDAKLDEVATEFDHDKRLDLANEADALIWAEANTIPLWQSYDFYIQNKDLANFGAAGFESIDWTLVGYVKGSDKLNG